MTPAVARRAADVPVSGNAPSGGSELQYGGLVAAHPLGRRQLCGPAGLPQLRQSGGAYDRTVLLGLPQPYDFHASTERFRSYGADRANLWHEGGLHRVVAGAEVRIEPALGGVQVEPCDEAIAREVAWLLGAPLDLDGFWTWAVEEPALAALREPLLGYRPPLVPDRWEMLVTLITAQQVSLHSAFAVRSRFIECFGARHGEAGRSPPARGSPWRPRARSARSASRPGRRNTWSASPAVSSTSTGSVTWPTRT